MLSLSLDFTVDYDSMHITALYIYPIKSLGGIPLSHSEVTPKGLALDRRWMLTDANFKFITQRQHTALALFKVQLLENELVVTNWATNRSIVIPQTPQTTDYKQVTVWDDEVRGQRVSDEVDVWFTEELGFPCHLFYQPEASVRAIDAKYTVKGDEEVSFADGYPILVISEESLADLNARSSEEIQMLRFRPNVVVANCLPHAEDELREFTVGSAQLAGVKPCARCVLTTINPNTGQKGSEPLKTLASYRKVGNKILFGQNVVVLQTGHIAVGDNVILS